MIYGDMLIPFTELFRSAEYFSADKKTVAGWENRKYISTVKGVLETTVRSDYTAREYTLEDSSNVEFWTKSNLETGNYLEINGVAFHIIADRRWKREGEFNIYSLEEVRGNTDTQTKDSRVDYGVSEYN